MRWRNEGERQTFVEGLAAQAITMSEMGASEQDVHAATIRLLEYARVSDLSVIRDAAEAVRRGPHPVDESPDELAAMEPIREALGMASPSEQLEAALRAREWLLHLADRVDGA